MKLPKILFLSMLLCGFISVANGADVVSIGVVDFQMILETSKVGKAAQTEIKDQGEKMEKTLKDKGAEIEELKKKLERDGLVIDRDSRDEKEKDIRNKINDLKTLQKKYMTDFRELESKLIDQIKKQLMEIIQKIGKEEGYSLILEKNEAGVLYCPTTNDITEKVIRVYNKQLSK